MMTRVLIVDDEPDYRKHLKHLAEDENTEVETAENAHDALERVKTFTPQILVADWMLSNSSSGLDLSRILKKMFPGLITIIITGYPDAEFRNQAEEGGAFAFLHKPFGSALFRDTIRKAVSECRTSGNSDPSE